MYDLPERLIAQTPLPRRDGSRLLLLDKTTGRTEHRHFYDLPDFLRPGDCMVLNDSRVIPARLIGARPTGGAVEVMLLRQLEQDRWECLVRPGKKMRPGQTVVFADGALTGHVEDVTAGGERIVRFEYQGIFLEVLERLGRMPLPPYIKQQLDDHEMHSEYCIVPAETAEAVNRAHAAGGRVIAVGTTSCRTLESFTGGDGVLRAEGGWTNIFIYPGYKFKCIDALVTNFHLPGSTLMMLVSALAGREHIMAAYAEAIREEYRFFSFGDAMFIY